jgi:hypothetical protein
VNLVSLSPVYVTTSARALSLSVLLAKRVNRSHPERDGPRSLSPLSLFSSSRTPSLSFSLFLWQPRERKKKNLFRLQFLFFFFFHSGAVVVKNMEDLQTTDKAASVSSANNLYFSPFVALLIYSYKICKVGLFFKKKKEWSVVFVWISCRPKGKQSEMAIARGKLLS